MNRTHRRVLRAAQRTSVKKCVSGATQDSSIKFDVCSEHPGTRLQVGGVRIFSVVRRLATLFGIGYSSQIEANRKNKWWDDESADHRTYRSGRELSRRAPAVARL